MVLSSAILSIFYNVIIIYSNGNDRGPIPTTLRAHKAYQYMACTKWKELCCVIQSLGSKSEILTKLFFPGCMGGPIIQACFLRNLKHNYPLTDIPTPLNYCLLNLLAYKNNTGDCFTLIEVWIHHKTTFTSRPNLIWQFLPTKIFHVC